MDGLRPIEIRALRRRLRLAASALAGRPLVVKPAVTKSTLDFEIDDEFNEVYDEAVRVSESESPTPMAKMYLLSEVVKLTHGVVGLLAECGCYRGVSAYVVCHVLRTEDATFKGKGVHLFDSFQGLSDLSPEDQADNPAIPVGGRPRRKGMFAAPVETVRQSLASFPRVTIHGGWIPESFAGAPEGPYRFVHLDLDLHDPTRDSLEFFHPRLAPGGVIVCDDYGAVRWPGVTKTVKDYCERSAAPLLPLPTGQAIVFAGSRAPLSALST